MICKQCGAQIDDHAAECPFCGAAYEENIVPETPEIPEVQSEAEEQTEAASKNNVVNESGTDESLTNNDQDNEIEEILDENEIKRRRQMERMRAEKQSQLEEIEKRRKLKKRKQARNKAIIAIIVLVVTAGCGYGGYTIWKHHSEAPDVIISTQQPVDDSLGDDITPSPEESEEAATETAEEENGAEADTDGGNQSNASTGSAGASGGSGSSSGNNWRATGESTSSSASGGSGGSSSGSSTSASSGGSSSGSGASVSSGGSSSGGSTSASSVGSISSGSASVSAPSFGGKTYSSEGGYKDGKFTSALVTGVEVIENGGKNYMSFKYNGATYYAKVSSDTTTSFVAGRPMTITAFKTSETLNGNDVYEITTVTNYTGKYVFPNSGFEKLTDAELAGKTATELYIGRNEIFARHGRKFQNADLREYFSGCSWYKIKDSYNYDNEASNLNSIEQANVDFILQYEAKLNK
ncbi:MAG: YARHG domain-containing protein [Candidatus Ornithomonoglobus sp.]